jgi:putative ABC transport system permease protein
MRGPLLRIGPLVTAAQPPVAATVTTRDDIDAYRILYEDIDGDAHLWRIIALLVLLGAGFAALNLTTRIVEAQRREIGIGMALGFPRGCSRCARCCSA